MAAMRGTQSTTVYVREGMNVEELLAVSCSKKQLVPCDHFLKFYTTSDMDDYFVPHRNELIEHLVSVGLFLRPILLVLRPFSKWKSFRLFHFTLYKYLLTYLPELPLCGSVCQDPLSSGVVAHYAGPDVGLQRRSGTGGERGTQRRALCHGQQSRRPKPGHAAR